MIFCNVSCDREIFEMLSDCMRFIKFVRFCDINEDYVIFCEFVHVKFHEISGTVEMHYNC